MKRGRPHKKPRGNISGLKNQKASPVPSQDSSHQSASPTGSGFDQQQDIDFEERHHITFDGTRINWEEEDTAPLDSDIDDQMELDIWDDEDLAEKLEEMMRKSDEKDCDWLSPRLQQQHNQRKGGCKLCHTILQMSFMKCRCTSNQIWERTRCDEQI